FRLAGAGPSPLSVDGRRLGHGLPRRRIPLPELASILMHPSTSYPASDEAWRLLVTQARAGQAGWVVGAVGVALPGLRHAAHRLSRTFAGDAQAEVLTGFLAALPTIDLDPRGGLQGTRPRPGASGRRHRSGIAVRPGRRGDRRGHHDADRRTSTPPLTCDFAGRCRIRPRNLYLLVRDSCTRT